MRPFVSERVVSVQGGGRHANGARSAIVSGEPASKNAEPPLAAMIDARSLQPHPNLAAKSKIQFRATQRLARALHGALQSAQQRALLAARQIQFALHGQLAQAKAALNPASDARQMRLFGFAPCRIVFFSRP